MQPVAQPIAQQPVQRQQYASPSSQQPFVQQRPVSQSRPQRAPEAPPQKAQPYVAAVIGNSACNKVMLSTRDIMKIGRSPQSCQFVVSGDTNISRIHCYLRYDGEQVYLCDNSSNGTFFENGTQLARNKEYAIAAGAKFYLATRNHMFVLNV